jgi:hypothetical protein
MAMARVGVGVDVVACDRMFSRSAPVRRSRSCLHVTHSRSHCDVDPIEAAH